jgi:hypothetical protein
MSAAAALTVMEGNGIDTARRPSPPSDLFSEEAKVWKVIVSCMPAGWFPPETHPNLKQLCRREVRASFVASQIHAMEKNKKDKKPFSVFQYQGWLREEARITHDIAVLERQMRLSQGSTYRQEYTKKRHKVSKPAAHDNNGGGSHHFGVA